jgi:hypothetical protein
MTSLKMLMNFHVNFILTNFKVRHTSENGHIFNQAIIDVLPSHGVKPTWGFHKVKLRKLWLSGTLPASNSKKG